MSSNLIWLIICVPLAIATIYYFSPFIAALWVKHVARAKGRKIGRVQYQKISYYFHDELEKVKKEDEPVKPSKEVIDKINNKVTTTIDKEYNRIEERYTPRIDELQKRIDSIEASKKEALKSPTDTNLPKKMSIKGKSLLEGFILDSGFWKITCLVYIVFLLLVVDTIVSSEWISQIGMFSKGKLLFTTENLHSFPLLKHFNFAYNTILGFIMNAGLLILLHIILHKIETPPLFKKTWVKIVGCVCIILVTILLRFLLPNSGSLVKDVMFTFLWLLLFISAYALLQVIFKQIQSNLNVISNLLFFVVIPISLLTYMCGGFIGLIGKILEEILSAIFELKKARLGQIKKNIEVKKENLEDGFHEGITDEVRE